MNLIDEEKTTKLHNLKSSSYETYRTFTLFNTNIYFNNSKFLKEGIKLDNEICIYISGLKSIIDIILEGFKAEPIIKLDYKTQLELISVENEENINLTNVEKYKVIDICADSILHAHNIYTVLDKRFEENLKNILIGYSEY